MRKKLFLKNAAGSAGKDRSVGRLLNDGPPGTYLNDSWGFVPFVTTLPTGKKSGGIVELGRSGM